MHEWGIISSPPLKPRQGKKRRVRDFWASFLQKMPTIPDSYTLYIGNKNYSSWSVRPWLLLRQAGIPFTEHVIPLFLPGSAEKIAALSPSGKVPLLQHRDLQIWDSLAICEYLAERHPHLWPQDPQARAVARAVSAEMHSGFQALRNDFTMNIRRRTPRQPSPEVQADIARIAALWTDCRARFGQNGPFLFGEFSIADAMFGPVCFRFQTYGVNLDGAAGVYVRHMLAQPAFQELARDAAAEPFAIAKYEVA